MNRPEAKKSAISIGTFDGIHLGHRALLARTTVLAAEHNLKSIAYTFELPPQNYLGRKKSLLMPSEKKLGLLGNHVEQVEVAPFLKIQPLTPEAFVKEILVDQLKAAFVIIGEDFCFGKNRQGNVTTLSQLSSIYDFEVVVIPPVQIDELVVSSTAIREALKTGQTSTATKLLGKPHRIWGDVVEGTKEASKLGFPTANLSVDENVISPAEGIYACHVKLGDELYGGALYIGRRPTTAESDDVSIEVHILDQEGLELYGKEIEVQLIEYIRPDKHFDSFEELKRAIADDIEAVKTALDKA